MKQRAEFLGVRRNEHVRAELARVDYAQRARIENELLVLVLAEKRFKKTLRTRVGREPQSRENAVALVNSVINARLVDYHDFRNAFPQALNEFAIVSVRRIKENVIDKTVRCADGEQRRAVKLAASADYRDAAVLSLVRVRLRERQQIHYRSANPLRL